MKHKILIVIITALFLSFGLTNTAFAGQDEGWYITPSTSYIDTDNSRFNEDDQGLAASIAFGKEISKNLNLELDFSSAHLDTYNAGHIGQKGVDLDALFFLNKANSYAPYLTAGIGMVSTERSGQLGSDTNPTVAAGIGLLTDFGIFERAKFRTEVRFEQEIDTGDYAHDDLQYTLGFNLPIGDSTPKPIVVMTKDTDGDGVNDADDKCPATPAGTVVNSYGCKIDGDSDNDGVKDSMDQCPNTPRGVAVDKNGCKVVVKVDNDLDKDGVPNSQDQCPATPAGARVDFKGCEIKQVISLPNVNFELNSAKLTASSVATLDGAAATLNKFTDINAEVAGHTDATGSDSYNMSLSDKRAKSVKDYLISKGVSAARLSSKGYGETQPIADNSNKQGRAMNRRVVLNVIK